jgi:hypothetical protein
MDLSRARGTAIRRVASGGRRSTTAHGHFSSLAGRAATELERLRPTSRHRRPWSRSDSIVERIKHLV